ncbi:MAG: hypothetical protein LLG04_13535 [Parachlamydia sp.]|nr:hypothetical protein [Parachlamydia sp.]
MIETLRLRTSIKPALKKALLFRGTLIATAGIALLLFAGLTLPVASLERWGLFILGIALLLITVGLLPYKRLTRLEIQPHELLLTTNQEISFFQNRIPRLTLIWSNIEKSAYIDHHSQYGIALWLKNPDPALENTIQKCRQCYGCDLFFPFFSARSYQEMIEFFN